MTALAQDRIEVKAIELENGRPKLTIRCPASFTGRVEVYSTSQHPANWAVSATNLPVLPGGSLNWTDNTGTGVTRRFYIMGTDIDSDSDHAADSREILIHHTDPGNSDMDNDGALDGDEIYFYGSNPFVGDSDGDVLPDWWETYYLGTLSYGGRDDPDRDGIDNGTEFLWGTRPNTALRVDTEDLLRLRVVTPLR